MILHIRKQLPKSIKEQTLLLLFVTIQLLSHLTVQAQIITTFAGTHVSGYTGDGGPATAAQISRPFGVATDNSGNVYIADQFLNNCIRKVNNAGIISTITGTAIGFTGDGGPAISALFTQPDKVVCDNAGNLYFSDQSNLRVRKINTAGIVTTVAGNGQTVTVGTGDGGPATAASFVMIGGIACDNAGNIYVSDYGSYVIRKINSAGIISTIAGTPGVMGFSGDGGPATAAMMKNPIGLTVSSTGNLYFTDETNRRIRMIDNTGIISTIAGTGTQGYTGDGGLATMATLGDPVDVALDNSGNIYIADASNRVVRRIDKQGIITTYAGNGTQGYTGDGGLATAAEIGYPNAIAVDNAGNLYISDAPNFVIRKVSVCQVASAVSITASATTICAGTTVVFSAQPTNGGSTPSYQWLLNGNPVGIDSNQYMNGSLADKDVVSCIMTGNGTCTTPVTAAPITLTVNPLPVIVMMPDTTIVSGTSLSLYASVTGATNSYTWAPANSLNNPSAISPIASPQTTTTYQLTVQSDAGCEATGKVTVSIFQNLQMPTAFTPNKDGLNDIFKIPSFISIHLVSFEIFNRFGNKLLSTKDINSGWNGTAHQQPADPGTYIWRIVYLDIVTGKPVEVSGTVLLIR